MSNSEYDKTIDMMKNDISSLKGDLAHLIKLFEKDGLDRLKSTVETVKSKCDTEAIENKVKENPKESLAIAFTVGAVFAMLLGHRR
jgi:ElaB/YqjD/DUF883 family membrane-anchored ribosome-binding protein